MATCCRDSSPDPTPAADRHCCGAHTTTHAPTGHDTGHTLPDAADHVSDARDERPDPLAASHDHRST